MMGWMGPPQLTACVAFALLAVYGSYKAAGRARRGDASLWHSRPIYHLVFLLLFHWLPCVLAYALAVNLMPASHPLSGWPIAAIAVATGALSIGLGLRRIRSIFRARNRVEQVAMWGLRLAALLSILITAAIVFSVLSEAIRFFGMVSLLDFITGTGWSPQMALRADQAGGSGAFGAVPLFVGTLLITLVAMSVAVPVGLFAAIYLAEYASARQRNIIKPLLEMLAGVPTVVYGFFAIITVAPGLKALGAMMGLSVAAESALAAGMVMGIMIVPFISSMADDVMRAVPLRLREASLGLGATRSETICRVILPAALPGIMGGVLLAVSRAIGETMIVVMAAGLAANLSFNPLEAVTTVTVQIVTLLVGDQEFDSPKTLAAFALGLTLFVFTLAMNMTAQAIVRRYREQYE